MSASTSSGGRAQFSCENAYSVSMRTPSSWQPRTTVRTTSLPRRWPSSRERPRASAQRPLPSGMIATCRGSFAGSRRAMALDVEDLRLLGRHHRVHLLGELVGELLDLRLPLV